MTNELDSYASNHLGKLSESIVVKGSGAERQSSSLFSQSTQYFRMTMTLIYGRVSRQEIVVMIAFRVPDVNSFSFGENHRKWMITKAKRFELLYQHCSLMSYLWAPNVLSISITSSLEVVLSDLKEAKSFLSIIPFVCTPPV